jgi:hypothetical protein
VIFSRTLPFAPVNSRVPVALPLLIAPTDFPESVRLANAGSDPLALSVIPEALLLLDLTA